MIEVELVLSEKQLIAMQGDTVDIQDAQLVKDDTVVTYNGRTIAHYQTRSVPEKPLPLGCYFLKDVPNGEAIGDSYTRLSDLEPTVVRGKSYEDGVIEKNPDTCGIIGEGEILLPGYGVIFRLDRGSILVLVGTSFTQINGNVSIISSEVERRVLPPPVVERRVLPPVVRNNPPRAAMRNVQVNEDDDYEEVKQ